MALLIQQRQLGLQLRQDFRNRLFSLEYGFVAAAHVGRGEAECDGPNDDIRARLFMAIDGFAEDGKSLPQDVGDPCRASVLGAV